MDILNNQFTCYLPVLEATTSYFAISDNQGKLCFINSHLEQLIANLEYPNAQEQPINWFTQATQNALRSKAERESLHYTLKDQTHKQIQWHIVALGLSHHALLGIDITQTIASQQLIKILADANSTHTRILETIIETAVLLEESQDLARTLSVVFEKIGEATQVDRVYFFEKDKYQSSFSQKSEWVKPGIHAQLNNPKLQNIDTELFDTYYQILLAGKSVSIEVDALPPIALRAILEEQNIAWVLIYPILANGTLLGFIGFDYCSITNPIKASDAHFLMAFSNNISHAIERLMAQKVLNLKSNILLAVGFASELLFKSQDFMQALTESCCIIGPAAQVDRVYYFEKNSQNDLFSQKIEWVNGTASPQINNPMLQDIDTSMYPSFLEQLFADKPYSIRVPDLPQGELKDLLIAQDIISLLNIPIRVFGQLHGFIGFDDCTTDRIWTQDEISLLTSLTHNIASAIERSQRQAHINRKIAIMSAVGIANEQLFGTANVFETMEQRFAAVGNAAGADRVYYFEQNEKSGLFCQKIEWTREGIKPEIDNPELCNIDLKQFDFFYNHLSIGKHFDITTQKINHPVFKEIIEKQQIISLLCIPIMVFGKFVAFIGFDNCTNHNNWSDDEISVLTSLANSMANAFEKLETQKKLRYQAEILQAIAKTSDLLINFENLNHVINQSFAMVGEVVAADRVYYFKKNKATGKYVQKAEWVNAGIKSQIDNLELQDLDSTLYPELKEPLEKGQPYYLYCHEMHACAFKQHLLEQGILSILNIPLKIKGEVYGFIGFDDCTLNRTWTKDEISLLESLTKNLSNAIEKEQNQQRLIESEQNFREINETIDDVFWLFNISVKKVDYISPSCKRIFGHEQQAYYDKPDLWKYYIIPQDHELIAGAHKAILEQGFYEITYRIMLNGSMRYIYEKSFPIKNAHQNLIRNVGISSDVTERVTKDQEQEHLLQVVKQQNERLTNFAHIISHNIRSHSSNLSSLMDLITQAKNADETTFYHTLMQRSTAKLADTIQNLNEFITIQNYAQLEQFNLYLKEEIDKTCHALAADIERFGVTIINQVAADTVIKFVPAYLDSILLNFLSNAIKYRSIDRKPVVSLTTDKMENYLRLAITDNGLGIDLEKHGQKLFGMFKTFHSHKEARGLGLFIAKSQIEAMRGKVEATSKPNIGTTFYIYFYVGK